VGVSVEVCVAVRVGVAVTVLVAVGTCVAVKVEVAVGVSVEVCVAVRVGVAVTVLVAVGTCVAVKVEVAVGVSVEVCVAVRVGVAVAVKLGVAVGVAVEVGVQVGVSVGLLVGVAVEVCVCVGVRVGVAVAVAVKVAVAVGVGIGGLQDVITRNGAAEGSVKAKLIQPMFSAQAHPEKAPVPGSIWTPVPGTGVPPIAGLKSIQPAFSAQARPERLPLPSFSTPYGAVAQLDVFLHERLIQPRFSAWMYPSNSTSPTRTPGSSPPGGLGSALSQPEFSWYAYWASTLAGSTLSCAPAGLAVPPSIKTSPAERSRMQPLRLDMGASGGAQGAVFRSKFDQGPAVAGSFVIGPRWFPEAMEYAGKPRELLWTIRFPPPLTEIPGPEFMLTWLPSIRLKEPVTRMPVAPETKDSMLQFRTMLLLPIAMLVPALLRSTQPTIWHPPPQLTPPPLLSIHRSLKAN
jgi:hypothetical protein